MKHLWLCPGSGSVEQAFGPQPRAIPVGDPRDYQAPRQLPPLRDTKPTWSLRREEASFARFPKSFYGGALIFFKPNSWGIECVVGALFGTLSMVRVSGVYVCTYVCSGILLHTRARACPKAAFRNNIYLVHGTS